MKYRQVTGDEALKLCREGAAVLAARYVENMTFRQAAESMLFLAPEPEQDKPPEPCATSHSAPLNRKNEAEKKNHKALGIDARKVAELKAAGKAVAEIADAVGVTPKQMSQWIYNNKTEVEESMQQLRDSRELAKMCCGKEDK